jgi:hypothetical protein
VAAVLAGAFVALEDVMAGELDFLFRKSIEHKQHNDSRDPDPERDGGDHFVLGRVG